MKSFVATRSTVIAWLPAALLIAASLAIVAGISVISNATAATGSGGTVDVTGSVGGGILAGLGPDASCGGESISAFATTFAKSDGCTVAFGSNNNLGLGGAELTFVDADGQAPFFCTKADGTAPNPAAGGDCTTANFATGDSNRSVMNAPANGSPCNVADCFGLALMTVDGDTGIGATYGSGVVDPTATGPYATPNVPIGSDNAWSPIDGTSRQLCYNTGANSVSTTCTFAFGAQGTGGTQATGTYGGRVAFTVTTR